MAAASPCGHHVEVLRLSWPENPKTIRQGEPLDLGLTLTNDGAEGVEFEEAFLIMSGRLLDGDGREIATPGLMMGRRLPLIHYRVGPGQAEHVRVAVALSED